MIKKLKLILIGAALTSAVFTQQASAQNTYKKSYSVSIVLNNNFPWGQVADKWVELVTERSQGKIKLKIFPNSGLVNGDQTQEFSAMRSGLIDMAIGSTINWSPQVPAVNLFSLPFLIEDENALDAVINGPAGKMIFKSIEKKGIIPFGWAENGFRELSNSKHPITSPDDLKGLKIRVVGSPLFLDTFTALGANPAQMSWGDAKTALATGAVDGQENPLNVFNAARVDQASQKYLSLWNYMVDPLIFAANPKVWKSFSKEDQELLTKAAADAGAWEMAKVRAENIKHLEVIKSRGVIVSEINHDQKQVFKAATKTVYDKWVPKIGNELVDAAIKSMKEASAK